MTLREFNAADLASARAVLLQCCGSAQWVEEMLARRPFRSGATMLAAGESVWWTVRESDWREAFAAHPKIGEKKLSEWCSQEQEGVGSSSAQILKQLAQGNEEYERRFGWIFLINATGKTGSEILKHLQARLGNESKQELLAAAGEQAAITELRLRKLLQI